MNELLSPLEFQDSCYSVTLGAQGKEEKSKDVFVFGFKSFK